MSLTINSSPFSLSTPPDQVKAQKESPTSDQLVYNNLNLSKAGNQAIQKRKMTTGCWPCHSLISLAVDATHISFPALHHLAQSAYTPTCTPYHK